MRTFGTILALLLIFFGLVVAGLIVVRIWQDNGLVQARHQYGGRGGRRDSARLGRRHGGRGCERGRPTAETTVAVAAASRRWWWASRAAVCRWPTAEAASDHGGTGGRTGADGLSPWRPSIPARLRRRRALASDTAVVAVGTLRVYSAGGRDLAGPARSDGGAGACGSWRARMAARRSPAAKSSGSGCVQQMGWWAG